MKNPFIGKESSSVKLLQGILSSHVAKRVKDALLTLRWSSRRLIPALHFEISFVPIDAIFICGAFPVFDNVQKMVHEFFALHDVPSSIQVLSRYLIDGWMFLKLTPLILMIKDIVVLFHSFILFQHSSSLIF